MGYVHGSLSYCCTGVLTHIDLPRHHDDCGQAASSEQCPVALRAATDAMSAEDWPRLVSSGKRAMSECSIDDDVWELAAADTAMGLNEMGRYADAFAVAVECVARRPSTIHCRAEQA